MEKMIRETPKLRISIVENDSTDAIAIKKNLEESGYEITGIYCSGKEAVKSISETETDVILIEIVLGGTVDGIDTVERIMLAQSIPVVFIAGSLDQINVSRMSFITNYTILLKPFTYSELIKAIEVVYKSYMKSIDFYRNCRRLILEVNPYKIDFIKKVDYLIKKLSELEEVEDYEKTKYLLNEIRSHFRLYINTEDPAYLLDKNLRRSIGQIIEYADQLLEKLDGMDTEEIKNYISRISIYLKVYFYFHEKEDGST